MKRKTLKTSIFSLIYFAVIVACVALDQLTKLWIFDGLLQGKSGASVNVLGNFLRFEAVYNKGAAFGIAQGDSANIVFFIITVVGIPLFLWLLFRSRTRSVWGQIGFAFIVGGTIGNAIDRAFIQSDGSFFGGKVRDFIAFSVFPPVFNIADSFLTVGVVLAILAIVFFDPDSLLATVRSEKTIEDAPSFAQDEKDGTEVVSSDQLVEQTSESSVDKQTLECAVSSEQPSEKEKLPKLQSTSPNVADLAQDGKSLQSDGDVHEKN